MAGVGSARHPTIDVAASPSWLNNTRALLNFLDRAKTWAELDAWPRKKSGSYLRHSLAWLESQGEARTFYSDGVLYWVRVGGLWATNPPHDKEGEHDHNSRRHLDPVIPKAPHVPSIPRFEATDEAVHDTLPPDTDPDPSVTHTGDTVPTRDTIYESEREVDHHAAISTVPSPND